MTITSHTQKYLKPSWLSRRKTSHKLVYRFCIILFVCLKRTIKAKKLQVRPEPQLTLKADRTKHAYDIIKLFGKMSKKSVLQ